MRHIVLAGAWLSLGHGLLAAQASDPTKPTSTPGAGSGTTGTPPATPPTLPSLDSVRVLAVRNVTGPADTVPTRAGIGDQVHVYVRDLRSLASRAACESLDDQPVTGCTRQKIALYLDGREIKDLYPESGAPESGAAKLKQRDGVLHFHIQRGPKSDEAWADLLGSPRVGPDFFTRPTRLSVGLENTFALPTDVAATRFELVRIRQARFWFATAGLLLLVAGIWSLATRTNLLRDLGPSYPSAGAAALGPALKPYSLARCQMAFWFVLTVSAFVFIYVITGASDTITNSVLALIGISAGTFLGAAVIDTGATPPADVNGAAKVKELLAQLTVLETKHTDLEAQMADVTKQINGATANPGKNALATSAQLKAERDRVVAEHAAARAQLEALPPAVAPHGTHHFLTDILGDATAPGFHRFQIFVWTIVLGVLFVIGVWSRLSMPEFSATLLGLLGISAGTYLGLKFPEVKT